MRRSRYQRFRLLRARGYSPCRGSRPGLALHLCFRRWRNRDQELNCKATRPKMSRPDAVLAEDFGTSCWGLKPMPGRPSRCCYAPLLLGMAILIFVWKPRPGGRLQSDKAEDTAARLQPPSGPTLPLRKTWYCDGAEDERSKMRSAIMKMAMAKPLTSGRAGGPGPHPAQVGAMAKPTFHRFWDACTPKIHLLGRLREPSHGH